MNPTMAGIMGVFQIVWVYYGLLIASRPVIAWNMVAVVINFLSVWGVPSFRPPRKESSDSLTIGVAAPAGDLLESVAFEESTLLHKGKNR